MSISEKRIFRSYGMITMGTFLMALGTCLIYEPMSMVTGGFSGVGIVLEKLFGIPVFAALAGVGRIEGNRQEAELRHFLRIQTGGFINTWNTIRFNMISPINLLQNR